MSAPKENRERTEIENVLNQLWEGAAEEGLSAHNKALLATYRREQEELLEAEYDAIEAADAAEAAAYREELKLEILAEIKREAEEDAKAAQKAKAAAARKAQAKTEEPPTTPV